MAPKVNIYCLIDPRTNEARYVGKTWQPTAARLSQHIAHRARRRTPTTCWVKNVLASGNKPQMMVLETCRRADWREAEKFWIEYMRALGARLTNLYPGGDGPDGIQLSEDHKRKIGIKSVGRRLSDAAKEKISRANKGRRRPDLAARNMAAARLSYDEVIDIKRKLSSGVPGVAIMSQCGLTASMVSYIKSGKRYSHIALPAA